MVSFRVEHVPALVEHLATERRSSSESQKWVDAWVVHPNFEYDVRRLAAKQRKVRFSSVQMEELKSSLASKAVDLVSQYDPPLHGADGPGYLSSQMALFAKEKILELPKKAHVSNNRARSSFGSGPQPRIGLDRLTFEQKGWLAKAQQYLHELTPYHLLRSDPDGDFGQLRQVLDNATKRSGLTPKQLKLLSIFSDRFDRAVRVGQLMEPHRTRLIRLQKRILEELEDRPKIQSQVVRNRSLEHVVGHLPNVIRDMGLRYNIHPETLDSLEHILERFPDTLWAQELWDDWAELQKAFERAHDTEYQMSSAVKEEIKRGENVDKLIRLMQEKRKLSGL